MTTHYSAVGLLVCNRPTPATSKCSTVLEPI